jgi:hypothetical protein
MGIHGFAETVKAGGITLAVILVCSILVLAIAIERLVALWRFLDRGPRAHPRGDHQALPVPGRGGRRASRVRAVDLDGGRVLPGRF